MKKIGFAIFLLSLFASCRKDAPLPKQPYPFEAVYGTSGDETARMVKVLSNGKMAVCGYGAGPNGGSDFFLQLLNADGGQEWINYYGGAGDEVCWSFAIAPDSGFVLGGYTNSFGAGGNDFWIVKTDRDGNLLWSKTYGHAYNDQGINIRRAINGYFICGISSSGFDENAWMIRLDENGDSLWSFNWGGHGDDGAMNSCTGTDGSNIVIGYSNSELSNSTDGFLLVLDDSGQMKAQYEYGTDQYDEPHAVVPALDGDGWVICGHYGATASIVSHNVFVTQIGSDGTKRWYKPFGGADHDGGEGMTVYQNQYVIIARSNSRANSGEDAYLLQVGRTGNLIRERWMGSTSDDAGYGITTIPGAFIFCGYSSAGTFGGKDIYLARVNP